MRKRYTSLEEGTRRNRARHNRVVPPAPAPTEMKRRPHLRGDDDDASPLAGTYYFVFSILAAYAAPSSFRRQERKEEEEEEEEEEHIVTYTIPSDHVAIIDRRCTTNLVTSKTHTTRLTRRRRS